MDKLSIIIPAYIDTEAVDKKFRALLEELLRQKASKMQADVGSIEDLYGVLGYNNGAIWG